MSDMTVGQVWRHDRKEDTVVILLLEPHGHRDWTCLVLLDSWRDKKHGTNRQTGSTSRWSIQPERGWQRVS